MVAAFEAHNAGIADYTEAFAALDFATLPGRQAARDAAAQHIRDAGSDLERAAAPLFQTGKSWKLVTKAG